MPRRKQPPTPKQKAKLDAETYAAIARYLASGGKVTKITPEMAAKSGDRNLRVTPMW